MLNTTTPHHPHESGGTLGYRPGLDGFRAASLMAVLLFHGGFDWARGGFIGVTAFFVLSGFLITSLLLVERASTGRVNLRAFWVRRARRLVPAALLALALVAAYVTASGGSAASGVLGDALAAATWAANWRFVLADQSYADMFSDPSPLQHFWSLAVEEQFYIGLPVAAALLLGRKRKRMRRGSLAVAAAVALLASTAAAAAWHHFEGTTRAYYGTDARVAEPLVGVLLAVLLFSPAHIGMWSRIRRGVVDAAAGLALVGLAVLVATVDDATPALYRGGFLLAAVLSALVIAAAVQPGTLTSRLFSLPPLVAVGRVSYGAYLFHWPAFLWLSPDRTGLAEAPLFAVRVAATLSLALVSYVLVERPVRSGLLPRRVGALSWANATVAVLAALVLVTSTAPSSPSSTRLSSAGGDIGPPPSSATTTTADVAPSARRPSTIATSPKAAAPMSIGPRSPSAGVQTDPPPSSPAKADDSTPRPFERRGDPPPRPTTTTTQAATPDSPPKPPRLKVAVVGDSMAVGLGDGLITWAEEQGDVAVYNMAIGACPISRGGTRRVREDGDFPIHADCPWWADDDSELWKYFTEFDPDVVVVHDGLNEAFDRKLPSWAEYRWPGEPRFDRWLLDEYAAALRRLTSLGAVALFLNAPCVHWSRTKLDHYADGKGDQRIAHLNDLARVMDAQGVWTADLHRHLCPDGRFSDTVDDVENARPDGYHLSDKAAVVVAKKWLGPLVATAKPAPPPEQGGQQDQN